MAWQRERAEKRDRAGKGGLWPAQAGDTEWVRAKVAEDPEEGVAGLREKKDPQRGQETQRRGAARAEEAVQRWGPKYWVGTGLMGGPLCKVYKHLSTVVHLKLT